MVSGNRNTVCGIWEQEHILPGKDMSRIWETEEKHEVTDTGGGIWEQEHVVCGNRIIHSTVVPGTRIC